MKLPGSNPRSRQIIEIIADIILTRDRCFYFLNNFIFSVPLSTMEPQATSPEIPQTWFMKRHWCFWRTVTNIFFREIRPRGASIFLERAPSFFVAAPHHNQVFAPASIVNQLIPMLDCSFLIHCVDHTGSQRGTTSNSIFDCCKKYEEESGRLLCWSDVK